MANKLSGAFLLVFLPIISFGAVDPKWDRTPSPESYSLTKYGVVSPEMYTGAMSYSIPIFHYKDEDFDLPLSLDYHFDGFKPATPTGVVGMGWYLNCGGVVTREIRGVPDEENSSIKQNYRPRGYMYLLEEHSTNQGEPSYEHISSAFSGVTNGALSFDFISAVPIYYFGTSISHDFIFSYEYGNNVTPLADDVEGYETTPDLFHFSFLGNTGDFYLVQGNYGVEGQAFNTTLPYGKTTINFSPSNSGHPLISEVSIIDSFGYTYEFGGDIKTGEYTVYQGETNNQIPFSAWKLTRITAPNGRVIEFEYGLTYSSKHYNYSYAFEEEEVSHQLESTDNYQIGDFLCYDDSKLSYTVSHQPTRILIDGYPVVRFFYANVPLNEFGSSIESPFASQTTVTPKRLLRIEIYNRDGELVELMNFSHIWSSSANGSYPRMFLNKISSRTQGEYVFSYHKASSSVSFPNYNTPSLDHWGYWNGKTFHPNNGSIGLATFVGEFFPVQTVLQQNTTLFNLSHHLRDAVDTCAMYGGLNRIVYPTRGWSDILYEAHSASVLCDLTGERNNSYGIIPGGVRVKMIEHRDCDGSLFGRERFIYTANGNEHGSSSGKLLSMPRYILTQGYSLEKNGIIEAPYKAVRISLSILGHYPQNDIIGYSKVWHCHFDNSRTCYEFKDLRSVGGNNGSAPIVHDTRCDYTIVPSQVTPLYQSPLFISPPVQSKLVGQSIYASDERLLQKRAYQFSRKTIRYLAYWQNAFSHYARAVDDLVQWQNTEERVINYECNGYTETITRRYYNADGDIIKEKKTSGDISKTTYHRYWNERPDNTHTPDETLNRVSDIIETVTKDGAEYIVSRDEFLYDCSEASISPFSNPKPIKQKTTIVNHPVVVIDSTNVWGTNMLTEDGTNRIKQTLFSYYANYYPQRISLPGGDYLEFEWDSLTHTISKQIINDSTNRWQYEWKHLVGPTEITEPSGITTRYSYNMNGRLKRIVNNLGQLVEEYDYKLGEEAIESTLFRDTIAIGGNNYILRKTYLDENNCFADIEYFNGLGYSCGKVSIDASGNGKHLVSPIIYDALRRSDSKQYLPYVRQGNNLVWGSQSSILMEQVSYWLTTYSSLGMTPFAENYYDSSPAGRLLWSQQPGYDYTATNRKKHYTRRMNDSQDHILKIRYILPQHLYSPALPISINSEYQEGSLIVEENTDEDGRSTATFFNTWGEQVCKRVYTSETDTLDTYFVSDYADNVVCVIQPEGSRILSSAFSESESHIVSSTILAATEPYCFQFRYDGRGNLLRKKVPGGCWEDYYYDPRDNLYAKTDEGMLDNGLFQWFQYDQLDRITKESYVVIPNHSAEAVRQALDYGAPLFNFAPTKITTHEYAYYQSGFSLPSGMGFYGYSGVINTNDIIHLQGNLAWEKVYELPALDGSIRPSRSYVERTYGYDSLGRVSVIRERDENRNNDTQLMTWHKYDVIGNLIRSVEHHFPVAEAPLGTLHTWMEYDCRGRLSRQIRKINSYNLSSIEYSYDDLGRLVSKSVISNSGVHVGTQSYRYDIRGRLSNSIVYVGNDQVFSESLFYNNSVPGWASSPQWGGNISVYRSQQGVETPVTNSYYYDGASRLAGRTNSLNTETYLYNRNGGVTDFSSNSGGVTQNRSLSYSGNRVIQVDTSSYAYDARGNRITDTRNGLQISYNTLNLPAVVHKTDMTDSARFVYLANSTKLKTIDKDGHVVRYRGSLVIKQNSESGGESIAGALWDEGFTELSGSWWSGWTARDVWYVKDYLGNVRGKYDLTNLTEISRSDYTPYGERLDVSTTPQSTSYPAGWDDLHRRHFGGKEEVGDGGLNLLDFGARYYDPYSFSWTSVDPLTEKNPYVSPFSYCLGNPIAISDPDGRLPIFPFPPSIPPSIIGMCLERFGHDSTTKTIGYGLQKPFKALRVGIYAPYFNNITSRSAHFAINLSDSMGYPQYSTEGDMRNAIRHTIWIGILTSSFGSEEAMRIGHNHEDITPDTSLRVFDDKSEADTVADLLNNVIGETLGEKGAKSIDIAIKTINTLYNEGLWVVERNNNQYIVTRVSISEEQYKAALDELYKLDQNGHEKK